jgi:hypothetical protein
MIKVDNNGEVLRIIAIQSLIDEGFICDDDGNGTVKITCNNGQTPPSEAEIDAEVIRLQAEYDAQEYARNRASAFPSIGDQLDMQYHDQLDGTTTWKDAIAKVKSDNPKE